MLKDMTLGQYYQTASVIHKLDPRVKLSGTLLYIISLFIFESAWGYVLAAVFLGVVIKLLLIDEFFPDLFQIKYLRQFYIKQQSLFELNLNVRAVHKFHINHYQIQ